MRETLGDVFGKRTKVLGRAVQEHLLKRNVSPEKATEIGAHVTEVCGKADEKDPSRLRTTTLYIISPDEEKALYELAESVAAGREVDWNPQSILKDVTTAVDIAMFGRFYTDDSSKPPRANKKAKGKKTMPAEAEAEAETVDGEEADKSKTGAKSKRRHAIIEAAVHVAHSFTTHRSSPEDDYFSATDDLPDEGGGASHIDTQFFGSGVFYTYVTIDRDRLVANLDGNVKLADLCIEGLIRTLPSISPGGKRASFASHGKSQFALVEVGTQQPRSLAAAFCEPVRSVAGRGIDRASAERLLEQRQAFETVYGAASDRHAVFQAFAGKVEGSLEQITQIVKG